MIWIIYAMIHFIFVTLTWKGIQLPGLVSRVYLVFATSFIGRFVVVLQFRRSIKPFQSELVN